MIRTQKLKDLALDWMVAVIEEPELTIENFLAGRNSPEGHYRYSEDWAQGGPIIDREKICISYMNNFNAWHAQLGDEAEFNAYGPTPLIAAMRCYVASKLGGEVDVPEELV